MKGLNNYFLTFGFIFTLLTHLNQVQVVNDSLYLPLNYSFYYTALNVHVVSMFSLFQKIYSFVL